MKIIQSFWGGKYKSIENSYGWWDHRFHWLGWMLSCNQLLRFYDRVELYTDEFGYDILIRKLKLPYTNVHIVLDELNVLPNDLWAMAKIKTYSLQKEPFLHVDGDVFIFEPFPEKLLESHLIAQNQELTTKYYRDMWAKIHPHLEYLPQQMEDFHYERSNMAYNMGIIGGNDIEFIQNYCQLSLDFVYKNEAIWNDINLFNFNVFFEQVLFYEYAKSENRKVNVLIQEEIGDNEYTGFGNFEEVPYKRTYLHLIGYFKRDSFTCHKMLQYCWYNHPEWMKTLFDCTIPNWRNDFDFDFSQQENEKLIKYYSKNFNNEEMSNKRLIARDLFTYENFKLYTKSEKLNDDYQIALLPEIILVETSDENYSLTVRNLFNNSYIRKLDQFDQIILYELNSPKTKNELFNSLLLHFESELSFEEKEKFEIMLDERIENFLSLKVIIIKIN